MRSSGEVRISRLSKKSLVGAMREGLRSERKENVTVKSWIIIGLTWDMIGACTTIVEVLKIEREWFCEYR